MDKIDVIAALAWLINNATPMYDMEAIPADFPFGDSTPEQRAPYAIPHSGMFSGTLKAGQIKAIVSVIDACGDEIARRDTGSAMVYSFESNGTGFTFQVDKRGAVKFTYCPYQWTLPGAAETAPEPVKPMNAYALREGEAVEGTYYGGAFTGTVETTRPHTVFTKYQVVFVKLDAPIIVNSDERDGIVLCILRDGADDMTGCSLRYRPKPAPFDVRNVEPGHPISGHYEGMPFTGVIDGVTPDLRWGTDNYAVMVVTDNPIPFIGGDRHVLLLQVQPDGTSRFNWAIQNRKTT